MDDFYAINAAKTEFREGFNLGDVARILAIADPDLVSFSDGHPLDTEHCVHPGHERTVCDQRLYPRCLCCRELQEPDQQQDYDQSVPRNPSPQCLQLQLRSQRSIRRCDRLIYTRIHWFPLFCRSCYLCVRFGTKRKVSQSIQRKTIQGKQRQNYRRETGRVFPKTLIYNLGAERSDRICFIEHVD
jgi:hypothetical protein